MIRIVTGTDVIDAPGDFVVRVGPVGARPREASIGICIADRTLAESITAAVATAIGALELPAVEVPIVALRSRKRLAEVTAELAGAIAMIGVTEHNARHLVALIDAARTAGALGVQLVWDGEHGSERHVFAALEHARANPAAVPVVLATSDQPAAALQILISHRSRRSS